MGLVHSLRRVHRYSALVLGAIAFAGCFDPEVTHNMGDDSTGGSDSGTVETTLETTLDTTSPTTSPDTTATTTPADSSSDTSPPQCRTEDDCPAPDECRVVTCEDGMCVDAPADAGVACGDDTEVECNAADSCDGDGNCVDNLAPNGSTCTGCELGQCSCNDGACGDCSFAPNNNFITARAVQGWELTGGWALYREAPQSQTAPAIPFGGQVLGTDGNRSQPYPGGEQEDSHARSTPTTLPATLDFLSWNVDEGGGEFDNKSIAVSIDDGVTWVVVADCVIDPSLPFCVSVNDRAPDAWDPISIAVPADMVGEQGLVELRYNSGDSCCQFERGWFIDVTNFATECACGDDAVCGKLGGECGPGICGDGGECGLDAVAAGMACGDATDVECNAADACDGFGYCSEGVAASGLTFCHDCPTGDTCALCEVGVCNDCATALGVNDFTFNLATFGWVTESIDGTGNDWRIYFAAPIDREAGSVEIPFSTAPVFGTDGNRVAPYDIATDPFNQQIENSQVTTSPDLVPASITFDSWHVDEGGPMYDTKTIQISVDDGATWNVLVDCATADPVLFPFCVLRSDDRPGDVWDPISVDTAAYAGMVGRLRFTYTSVDSGGGGFERGWYIDNLSFAQSCNDPQFP